MQYSSVFTASSALQEGPLKLPVLNCKIHRIRIPPSFFFISVIRVCNFRLIVNETVSEYVLL